MTPLKSTWPHFGNVYHANFVLQHVQLYKNHHHSYSRQVVLTTPIFSSQPIDYYSFRTVARGTL